jgi:hypothetical protein
VLLSSVPHIAQGRVEGILCSGSCGFGFSFLGLVGLLGIVGLPFSLVWWLDEKDQGV